MSKSNFLNVLSSFSDKFSERINSIFAKKSDLTAHTGNTNIHITTTEKSKLHEHTNKTVLDNTTASFTSGEKAKLSGIATGAEVNKIEVIKLNGTTLSPDSSKTVNISIDTYTPTLATDADIDAIMAGTYS